MPSPMRRSARAPTKPLPSHSNSSTSSLSSARQDRTTKTAVINNHKSVTPHSQSSEEASEPPRRSQRAQPAKGEDGADEAANGEDAAGDEEETTRCICGHQDYPGPPLSEVFGGVDPHSEDAGGLFIQCDGCTVWQHGGCVGIVEESQSPDKYYCEECKPKQHELHTDSRGYVTLPCRVPELIRLLHTPRWSRLPALVMLACSGSYGHCWLASISPALSASM